MPKVYDDWEKLVEAVLKREELRRIALCPSFSSSTSADTFSRRSIDSSFEDLPAAEDSRIFRKAYNPAAHSSHSGIRPMKFKEIKKATNDFEPYMWVGQGGYGPVFKGWIDEHTLTAAKPGSGMAVAVKKRKLRNLQEHQEWLKEIVLVGQLCHANLVKLIGFSSEEDNMILVYEFMTKGSLDNHLFRRGHESLSWAMRIKVARDAARGLSFLHEREIPVIHRDIKTANILLDVEFNAKLSNFSLATDGPTGDRSHVSAPVIGSNGYAVPEYLATGHLTTKCDVYSFGVVLLELLSGLRVLDENRPAKGRNLVEWTRPYLGDKIKFVQIMDTRLKGQYTHDAAYMVSKLAAECLSTAPEGRPRMVEVVVALQLFF